jgi:ankyrin repeat protein
VIGTTLYLPMNRDRAAQFQREQLHRAAQDGDLARVQQLLAAKYPVNRFDDLGKTPLHYAVAEEHMEVVDALLRAGAHVNARDEHRIGDTPLGEYAGSCSYEMVKRLVDAGADPTIPGWMMLTALDRARDRKRPDARQVLKLLESAAARRQA